jgi:hypothetical protein
LGRRPKKNAAQIVGKKVATECAPALYRQQAMAEPDKETKQSEEFIKVLLRFSSTYAAELKAQRARLDELIGEAHWLSVGSYKEALVRRILREWMPRQFDVGTGFVLAQHEGKRLISNQVDVLIWDATAHAPIFRDGEFVIVPPEACRAAIEIKGNLDHASLCDAIVNLERITTLARFTSDFGPAPPPFRCLFAFDVANLKKDSSSNEEDKEAAEDNADCGDSKNDKSAIVWPKTILNSLWSHYASGGDREHSLSTEERIELSRRIDSRWSVPWIDMICLLGVGIIQQEEWSLNGISTPTYGAYGCDPQHDGTYGAMERALKMRLLAPHGLYTHDRPGMASTLIFGHEPRANPAYMPMARPAESIKSIGRLSPEQVGQLAHAYHRPHGAKWPKPRPA